MADPNNLPEKSSEGRQHLKFNKDVLPDFKRRPDNWETPTGSSKAEKMSEEETDSIIKWVGLGILVLVVAAIIGVTLYNRSAQTAKEAADSEPTAAESASQERESAKAVVKSYLGTRDIDARLRYVRRPKAVRPLMEDYYSRTDIYPLKVWNFEQVEPRNVEGWPFWYAVVNTPEGREIVLLEKTEEGFKVDWETHVGLNPMTPEEFVDERPEGSMDFRVYVTPDEYYNQPFDDAEKFLSVKLEFANSGVVLFGYLDKKSRDYTSFFELVDEGEQVPLILKLEWPEGDEEQQAGRLPQVAIKGLVSRRWLIIE